MRRDERWQRFAWIGSVWLDERFARQYDAAPRPDARVD